MSEKLVLSKVFGSLYIDGGFEQNRTSDLDASLGSIGPE